MRVPEHLSKHTTAPDPANPTITLFVYGTLKRSFWNHDRFCQNAIDIRPATTWGRLYQLPAGYPALEVPQSFILAHGTADPLADAATLARLSVRSPQYATHRPPSGDWDQIHGELITFPGPARSLPPIDRLEGFRTGLDPLYERVLSAVRAPNDEIIPAWLYVAGHCLRASGKRLRSGVWE